MTKRTKRYGGFRIGDRVYPKNKRDWRLDEGNVIQLQDGKVFAQFYDCGFTNPVVAFMPNELINLTRIEEEKKQKEYSDKIDKKINELFSPEDGKRLLSVFSENKERKGVIDYNPDNLKPFEDLFKLSIKERERKISELKERVANLETDTANILNTDPLPFPYTRDVYTSTNDY